ncbi:MAG: hypothetical protein PSV35_03560 [bacterium]|nr:hypothetical protein [bacterium]
MAPLHRRMVYLVWCDINLITATDAKKTPILDLKAYGAAVTVYAQLQGYVNQGIDAVGVIGTIDTTAGTVFLKNNQILTGGSYGGE